MSNALDNISNGFLETELWHILAWMIPIGGIQQNKNTFNGRCPHTEKAGSDILKPRNIYKSPKGSFGEPASF